MSKTLKGGKQRLTREMKERRVVQGKGREYGMFTEWKWSKALKK